MTIKAFKPYTPSRRTMTVLGFEEVTRQTPEKSLVEILQPFLWPRLSRPYQQPLQRRAAISAATPALSTSVATRTVSRPR